ncbi:MAG: hypothetical protein R3345_13515, partial [Fulvivirga sp.]|nr:hypothetical protein [Fulvivirga sp.]
MSTAKIELHQARDFGKKLNATIEFIKENFKPLFKSMLYISGPFIALGSLLFIQVFSGFFRIIINETQGVDPTPDNFISMAAYGLGGFIFLLLGGTALIATVHEYIILYEKKGAHTFSVDDVWQKVKKSFFSVLGTMLVYALILAGGYTLIIVPTVFLGMVAPGLMGIVLIVSYVGLLYISVTFSLIFIIRAYEKVSIGKAISR